MVALGGGVSSGVTQSRAAERAREALGKRAAGAAAAAARQLESLSPTKLGVRLSLSASPTKLGPKLSLALSPTKLGARLSPTKHRASLSGHPALTASPPRSDEARLGESLRPAKHRKRSSNAKPESTRQPGGALSPTRRERGRRVRTAKSRSADVLDC